LEEIMPNNVQRFLLASLVLASSVVVAPAALAADAAAPTPSEAKAPTRKASDAKADRDANDADGPTERAWSAGAQLGAGSDGLGLGVGARIGYTLPIRLYVGGAFTYYGTTATSSNGAVYILAPGAELGYDAKIGPVVLRPYAGLGMAIARASVRIGNATATASDSRAALWAGAQATYDVTPSFYLGGDVRLLTTLNGNGAAVAGFGSVGARF
jgi:hypothetical protein